jgi:hypothetical protein
MVKQMKGVGVLAVMDDVERGRFEYGLKAIAPHLYEQIRAEAYSRPVTENDHNEFAKWVESISGPATNSEAVALRKWVIENMPASYADKPLIQVMQLLYDSGVQAEQEIIDTRPSAAAVPEVDDAMVEGIIDRVGRENSVDGMDGDSWDRLLVRAALTATLTPSPRRIEREDAPTVDDGMGVGS